MGHEIIETIHAVVAVNDGEEGIVSLEKHIDDKVHHFPMVSSRKDLLEGIALESIDEEMRSKNRFKIISFEKTGEEELKVDINE